MKENSGFQDRLHAGIVITGGASQLKELRIISLSVPVLTQERITEYGSNN